MQTEYVRVNGIDFACRVHGAGDRVALLLHGFPDDPGSMDTLAQALAVGGYCAVAPYMRGYGPSRLPHGAGTRLSDLAADVVGLARALNGRTTYVFGHDWGAVAAYVAANTEPDLFAAMVTAAVPPPRAFLRALRLPLQRRRSWYMAYFQLPRLPEYHLARHDYALVERLWHDWSPGWSAPQARLAAVKRTLAAPGATKAALGYYRAVLRGVLAAPGAARADLRLALAPLRVPTLVLAGADDGCIGVEAFRDLGTDFIGPYDVAVMAGVGHFMHLERPHEVAQRVTAFFSVY